LEFFGDSITCGYGNEGILPFHWSPDTENNYLAYGPITARELNAEYNIEAWSGKGVVRNYGYPNITSPDPMPVYWNRSIAHRTDLTSVWSFKTWTPNAIIINLGTNDYSTAPVPPAPIFIQGYVSLINNILNSYTTASPAPVIVLLCGPLASGQCCDNVQRVARDLSLHYLDMQGILQYPQDFGCDGHPAVTGHYKMAQLLAPFLQKLLNW